MPSHERSDDPRTQGPAPRFDQPGIEPPGSIAELRPSADHGETTYVGLGRLTGRRAVVTGGDSGIGRATAIAFAREGADVLITHLPEERADAQNTTRIIEAAGRRGSAVETDLREPAACAALVEQAWDVLGGVDILVNNAARQQTHTAIEHYTDEEIEETFRVNILALVWTCRAALPRLQPGAVIINTASIQAYDPSAELLVYAATKAAVVNFTKGLAHLAMTHGVRVNAVAPGPVWTPLIPSTMPPEKVARFGDNTVFGRPAQPVEIAPLYVFLASDDARYVTGEVHGATGGRTPY